MSRRGVSHRVVCGQSGCTESNWYEFDTQREYREHLKRTSGKPWLCTRHRKPEENLRPDNLTTTVALVASKVPSLVNGGFLAGLFWLPEGSDRGGSGIAHGPGFNAYAGDFPEGTRLVVTTQVELPN